MFPPCDAPCVIWDARPFIDISTDVYLYYICNILNSKLYYGKTKEFFFMFVSLYFMSKTFLRLRLFFCNEEGSVILFRKCGRNVWNCAASLMIFVVFRMSKTSSCLLVQKSTGKPAVLFDVMASRVVGISTRCNKAKGLNIQVINHPKIWGS
jgi:hypothetical protein